MIESPSISDESLPLLISTSFYPHTSKLIFKTFGSSWIICIFNVKMKCLIEILWEIFYFEEKMDADSKGRVNRRQFMKWGVLLTGLTAFEGCCKNIRLADEAFVGNEWKNPKFSPMDMVPRYRKGVKQEFSEMGCVLKNNQYALEINKAASLLWKAIDGKKSVKELAEKHMDEESVIEVFNSFFELGFVEFPLEVVIEEELA